MVTERPARGSPEQWAVEQIVLAIDNDEDPADTRRYWLDDERLVVEIAYGGEEALHRLDDTVDMVLLDRQMPNVTGDDVFKKTRERGLDYRVVIMTTVEPDTDVVEIPFDAYLVEPASRSEVKKTIEELLVRSGPKSRVREYFALESTEAALDNHDVEKLREPEAFSDLRSRSEAIRAEHETTIRNRETRLGRLNRTNELLRGIDRALIGTQTRDEIEQTVRDVVADTHEAAVVLRRTAADTLQCTATVGHGLNPAGIDLDFVDEAFGVDEAAEDGFVPEGTPGARHAAVLGDDANDPDAVSALCVSIDYREMMYGALVIYDETDGFDDESVGPFSDPGVTIGNDINAIQSKRPLNGNSVVGLEPQVGRDVGVLTRLSAAFDCQLPLDGMTRPNDDLVCFISVAGVSGCDVIAATIDAVSVPQARVVADGDEESVAELRTDAKTVLSAIIDHSAGVEWLMLSEGSDTLTLHVTTSADHGALVEAVATAATGVSVVAKHEVERSVQSADSFQRALDSKLTGRQRAVLEASFISGYFEWPQGSTAREAADSLGISPFTFHEHLRIAERKLIGACFDGLDQISMDNWGRREQVTEES